MFSDFFDLLCVWQLMVQQYANPVIPVQNELYLVMGLLFTVKLVNFFSFFLVLQWHELVKSIF